jgi:hypothetical protein
VEPKDTAIVTDHANRLMEVASKAERTLAYIHLPVPIARDDEPCFAPLTGLKLTVGTKLYLGLVHAKDLEGTARRIAAARKVLPGIQFGVSSECGLGRTPPEELASILEISKIVSRPQKQA